MELEDDSVKNFLERKRKDDKMKRKDKDLEQGSPTPRLRTLLVCPWPVGNRAAQQEVSSQPASQASFVFEWLPRAS